MLIRNQNKVHGKHRGRSNFRLFTVTLYINTYYKIAAIGTSIRYGLKATCKGMIPRSLKS